jgi:uncharacterized protein involved in exopolysaccharide biosynthesis
MPYEYHEREQELEPQAASSRGGVPPRKITGVGVLDPPVPPKRQPPPTPSIPPPKVILIFAVIILLGLGASALLFLLR